MFHSIENYLIEREDCLFGGYDINADDFLNEKDGKRRMWWRVSRSTGFLFIKLHAEVYQRYFVDVKAGDVVGIVEEALAT